ncbi:oxalate decarboxylase, putative [Talaromyces stipitatus ATCC 10500]|uniref:Oxalate decarboxylase, putative n=1 Tax=Talaromyces stipitatus (strain ATCC 10500 / CBS 375.48 / QM 6759 / NRRL 1006) TaxID=441959 RepID=B8MQE3_TALSN|nr:oxalate decarboxylase, putative [Talaromyces stipitatus ATCC 10500]EED13345.1 oxalate decarboxylase, putative [Talaromyces stipitatus ATCC 10500]
MIWTQCITTTLLLSSIKAALAAPAAPSAATNPLRGDENLIGYSSTNTISNENTETISYQLAPGQTEAAIVGLYLDFDDVEDPQPLRGDKGGTNPGPRNTEMNKMYSDKYAPPGTDSGATVNAQWPLALSGMILGKEKSGWSRQQNQDVLPAATEMAGVNMRLEAAGYRELHWHVAAEWAIVLNGSCRIQAVNDNGQTFIDDVGKGDVWFFPPGIPHSIQALENGVEFMLVFDDGSFSETNTFLATEIFAHNPRDVLSKDLSVPVSAFQNIPQDQLFIFPGTPAPTNISIQNITGPAGSIPQPQSYSYHFSSQPAQQLEGGSVKIVDPLSFPIASGFSAALVTINPGGMREIHWHPSSDEWTFFIQGRGRATLFTPPSKATTFDYLAGDVAYFPKSNSHYIENTGVEELIVLEVLKADHYSDVSLAQWIGLTSKQIVQDTLNLSNETLSQMTTEKKIVVS